MAHRFLRFGLLLFLVLLLLSAAGTAGSKSKSIDKKHRDFSKYVEIQGATRIGTDQCVQCHDDLAKAFRNSSHALREVDCEQRHGSGSLHL